MCPGPDLSASALCPHSYRALPWRILWHRQHRCFPPGAALRAGPGDCDYVQRPHAGECAWGSCRHRPRPGVWMAIRLLGPGSHWPDRRSRIASPGAPPAGREDSPQARIPRRDTPPGAAGAGDEHALFRFVVLRFHLHRAHPGAGDASLSGRGDQGIGGLWRRHYVGQSTGRQAGGLEADAGAHRRNSCC